MAAYVKKNSSVEEQRAFQDKPRSTKQVGWLRDIPEPYIHVLDDSPESLERRLTEKEEYKKDEGELRMFQLLSEGIEDLYIGMIETLVRNTPDLREGLAVRTSSGDFYLVDSDPHAPTPTDPLQRIFVWTSTTTSSFHQSCVFGPLVRSWNLQENILLQDSLLSFAIVS